MDYAGLKTAINDWSDGGYDDAKLDEFIDLAEAAIRRRLVGYQREITTTLTTDADGEVALPSDFLGIRSVYYDTTPYRWNISGSTLYITDGESRSFEVTYYAKLPELSDSNPTNWLLDEAPDAYLFMCRAYQLAHDEDPGAQVWEQKAFGILDDFNVQNTVAQYSRTGLRLRQAP